MQKITAWVLEAALAQCRVGGSSGDSPSPSRSTSRPPTCSNPGFVDMVLDTLDRHDSLPAPHS